LKRKNNNNQETEGNNNEPIKILKKKKPQATHLAQLEADYKSLLEENIRLKVENEELKKKR